MAESQQFPAHLRPVYESFIKIGLGFVDHEHRRELEKFLPINLCYLFGTERDRLNDFREFVIRTGSTFMDPGVDFQRFLDSIPPPAQEPVAAPELEPVTASSPVVLMVREVLELMDSGSYTPGDLILEAQKIANHHGITAGSKPRETLWGVAYLRHLGLERNDDPDLLVSLLHDGATRGIDALDLNKDPDVLYRTWLAGDFGLPSNSATRLLPYLELEEVTATVEKKWILVHCKGGICIRLSR